MQDLEENYLSIKKTMNMIKPLKDELSLEFTKLVSLQTRDKLNRKQIFFYFINYKKLVLNKFFSLF